MSACNYGCSTLPQHQQIDCNLYAKGGIPSVALLECDHTITDFSNATQWTTNINSGKARIVNAVKGEIPVAAPVNIDNPVGCGPAQVIQGMTNTVSWTDANITAQNDDFYAKLNQRRLFVVIFMCEEDEIRVSSDPVDFQATPAMIPNTREQIQTYSVTGTFYTEAGTTPMALYNAPAGIFNN